MNKFRKICLLITTAGCLNYGIEAIFRVDLLKRTFTEQPELRSILYCVIAICGLISLLYLDADDDRI